MINVVFLNLLLVQCQFLDGIICYLKASLSSQVNKGLLMQNCLLMLYIETHFQYQVLHSDLFQGAGEAKY